jgi:peptide methionine sulfoxide reductase msrA/msrB
MKRNMKFIDHKSLLWGAFFIFFVLIIIQAFQGQTLSKPKEEEKKNMKYNPLTPEEERAIFASGCFWGTEYHMQKRRGVLETTVGFTGGHTKNPTYKEVCTGTTGHAEAVEVVFVPEIVSYEELAKLFFETHDPTQLNRQGPDIGEQYRSEIFYLNDKQKQTTLKLIDILKSKDYRVVTRVTEASIFWKTDDYHQSYYSKKNGTPYCHIYTKRF